MNVLFHLAAGTAVAASLSRFNVEKKKNLLPIAASGFVLGLLTHGILDYTPHCYPVNSKMDAIIGLSYMLLFLFLAKRKNRVVVAGSLLGSITPDLIDLLPAILNKQLSLNLPIYPKLFPWHFKQHSGSIYSGDCSVSNFNHFAVLLFCAIAVYLNRSSFMSIFRKF